MSIQTTASPGRASWTRRGWRCVDYDRFSSTVRSNLSTSTTPRSHTYLTKHAARELHGVGVKNLDVAVMRGAERRVTRALAVWIYSQIDDRGNSLYSGIRYTSRLGDYECWAIFDGTPVSLASETRLEGHAAVSEIAEAFDLILG